MQVRQDLRNIPNTAIEITPSTDKTPTFATADRDGWFVPGLLMRAGAAVGRVLGKRDFASLVRGGIPPEFRGEVFAPFGPV